MERRKKFVCESGGRRHSDEMKLLFFSVVLDRGIIRFIGSFDVLLVVWFTVSLYISCDTYKALTVGTGLTHFASV
jgi:hypothetical protein